MQLVSNGCLLRCQNDRIFRRLAEPQRDLPSLPEQNQSMGMTWYAHDLMRWISVCSVKFSVKETIRLTNKFCLGACLEQDYSILVLNWRLSSQKKWNRKSKNIVIIFSNLLSGLLRPLLVVHHALCPLRVLHNLQDLDHRPAPGARPHPKGQDQRI